MGEGLGQAVVDFFDVMTSGIGTFGKGLGTGLNEAAKYSFFEVSAEGAITGLGAYGGVLAIGAAITLGMSVCYLIFNVIG